MGHLLPVGDAGASPSRDEVSDACEEEVETSNGLPSWQEGDFEGGFDVRIWPERVILWLEQENLRDLIADPSTPESERQSLKRVLAMQRTLPKGL